MRKPRYSHLSYNSFVTSILRYVIPPFFRWFFRISHEGFSCLKLKPPYFLLAQHSCVWDPIIYNVYIKTPLHFVATNEQFRSPLMRFILSLVGSVAIKKSTVDTKAVLEIIHILKTRKESIAIFPEGVNTWDGKSSEIVDSTTKLIKYMKIPVICARSHGAYLSRPRWSRSARRGTLRVRYALCLTPNTIKKLDSAAISERIKKALYNNEDENQQLQRKHFISSKAAEYIERTLFTCPYCHMMESLTSKETFFYCRICCNLWRFRSDGFIQRRRHGPLLKQETNRIEDTLTTVAQWNSWQQKFLQNFITEKKNSPLSSIFHDHNMQLCWGKRRMIAGGFRGSCELTTSEFIFIPYSKRHSQKYSLRFAIASMQSINVQNKEKLEWTSSQDIIYQLRPRNPRVNTYKYLCALQLLSK